MVEKVVSKDDQIPLPLEPLESKLQAIVPDKRKRHEVITSVQAYIESVWIAPLPPPSLLQQYNEVLPGLAERIVAMTEAQGAHRRELERRAIRGQLIESRLGQLFGFLIGLGGLGVALWLGLTGHDAVAGTVGGATLVSLVTVFVLGRKQQEKSLGRKAKDN